MSTARLLRATSGLGGLLARPSLRNRQLAVFSQFSRGFHQALVLSDKKKNELRIVKELKKLHELKQQFDSAGFFDQLRLKPQLTQQEARIIDLQNLASAENLEVKIPTKQDPLDGENLKRYKVVYSFLLDRFVKECESFQGTSLNLNADIILAEIIEAFKVEHPDVAVVTKEEVIQLFDIYYKLLNSIQFLEELQYENETVNKILQKYSDTDLDVTEDHSIVYKETSDLLKISPNVVEGWFGIFNILSSVPFAPDDFMLTNALCGEEYARQKALTEEIQAIQKKFTDIYNPGKNPKKLEDAPFLFNSQKEDKKKDKNKPEEKDKFIDFDINLRGNNFKLFQAGVLGGLLLFIAYSYNLDNGHEISFQEFSANFLRKNLVSKLLVINNRTAVLELNENGKSHYSYGGSYYFNIGSVESFEHNLKEAQEEYKIPDQVRLPVVYVNEGSSLKLLINFLPTLLILGAIYYMSKKANLGGMGGAMGFGKSTAKKFNLETEIKIRFKDVAGMDEAKEEVMEFVKFLQNPAKYEKLGAKIPRGAILSGPPGTGKTLIAKATAGEAGVPFYSVSGSEFVEMFVGVGASRVRDLFKTARENAPSIVFVDEIDAIGKQRSKGNASGANDERETTLNQLLVEMDGFDNSDHVVVLAGTNRADILDKALMRPGRFDRHITIDNPELQGRKEIFEVHLKKIKLIENIDSDLSGRLAALTPGFSGADIANVCNEAALIGARYNAKAVTLRHFELAIERVIGGVEKKSKLLDPEEKKIVAYHEAGHAVCGWYLRYAHPLLKVSIIPRGQGALGYAQYLPPDQYLFTALQLYDRMIMTLGGRVSEELNFSSVTSGAHDDFKKVTGIAQSMVMRFGMSDKVGMVNYADTRSQDNLTKSFSDETNLIIDEEVQRIVKECYDQCTTLLSEKSKEVEMVAQELLKKEFITREDMIRMLGKRPFPETNDAFDKYLEGKTAFKNEKPAEEKKDDDAL